MMVLTVLMVNMTVMMMVVMMILKGDVRAKLSIDLSGCERSETQMPHHTAMHVVLVHSNAMHVLVH